MLSSATSVEASTVPRGSSNLASAVGTTGLLVSPIVIVEVEASPASSLSAGSIDGTLSGNIAEVGLEVGELIAKDRGPL